MVSLHKALSQSQKTELLLPCVEFQASSQKKRKWEENPLGTAELFKDYIDHHAEKRKSFIDIELHLKTPLPSDKWQQYLTSQARTNMKTPDSKRNEYPGQMSLDLELNLTYEKKQESYYEDENKKKKKNYGFHLLNESSKDINKKDSLCVLTPSLDGDYKEMIATVCMRCHMLVMLCKLSPTCPNCKFIHPPDQNPSKFWKKSRFSLLF